MKKVISVFLIAVTVICIFSGCQSDLKNSKQTTEKQQSDSIFKEDKINEEGGEETETMYHYIDNAREYIDSFSSEYWNESKELDGIRINKDYASDIWKIQMNVFPEGKLVPMPADLSIIVKKQRSIHEDCRYYKMNFTNNTILFPSLDITYMDDASLTDSNIFNFYTLRSDFAFNSFRLIIRPIDDSSSAYNVGEWIIADEKAYYVLDDAYYVQAEFYNNVIDEEREKALDQITKIISFTSCNQNEIQDFKESTIVKLKKGNIAIDDKITLLTDNLDITDYKGEKTKILIPEQEAGTAEDTCFNMLYFIKNNNGFSFSEWDMDIEKYRQWNESTNDLTETYYNDLAIYVKQIKNSDLYDGYYSGIVFKSSNGNIYSLCSTDYCDNKKISMEEYVKTMLDGVLDIK